MSKKVQVVPYDIALNQFIDTISKKYEVDKKELVKIYNRDGKIKISSRNSMANQKKIIDGTSCSATLVSGERRGELCKQNCSVLSKTKKYCARHLKYDDKIQEDVLPKEIIKTKCVYVFTSGDKKDEKCDAVACSSSPSRNYCSKHVMKELNLVRLNDMKAKHEKNLEIEIESKVETKKLKVAPKKSEYSVLKGEDKVKSYVWEHEGTRYVFDKATKKVTGIEVIINEEEKLAELKELNEKQIKFLKTNSISYT